MKRRLAIFFALLTAVFLLTVAIRGRSIDLQARQTIQDTSPGGPYEGSNSTSRFALTQAIVDNQSLFLSPHQAKFAAPDVAKYNDRYISLFTPGISLLGTPFYWLGKLFGLPQVFTYLSVTLTAVINLLLIFVLARRLGASTSASLLSGLIFLAASNALAYSTTFTQHHMTAALILASLVLASAKTSLTNSFLFGLFTGLGILVDLPNFLFQIPILIFFARRYLSLHHFNRKILPFIPGIAIPICLLFWYNWQTTGSPFRLAQFIGRAREFVTSPSSTQTPSSSRKFSLPYDSRKQLNGLYILLFSNERGWLYYFPVVTIGILGLALALKTKSTNSIALISITVILLILVSYSMFGDPWGGWSFGPRYLIPAFAVISVFTGFAVQVFGRNLVFMFLFFTLTLRSVYLSSLGSLTTNSIPPKQEAEHLSSPIPYTYKYNLQLVKKNISSSLVYNLLLSDFVNVKQLVNILTVLSFLAIAGLYFQSIHVQKIKRH